MDGIDDRRHHVLSNVQVGQPARVAQQMFDGEVVGGVGHVVAHRVLEADDTVFDEIQNPGRP